MLRKYIGLQGVPLNLLSTRSCRLAVQDVLLMTSLYETHLHLTVRLMRWRSGTDTTLFSDSFGNLNEFNTFCFALPIRRQVGGYHFRTETLLSF